MPARKKIIEVPVEEPVMVEEKTGMKINSGAGVVIILAVLAGFFWYKTNTWPVVAVINGKPLTRFEVDQQLFNQDKGTVIEGLITQTLIKQDVEKRGIKATDAEVDAKIEEIKQGLAPGQELEKALAAQGMTLAQFKEQVKLRVEVEKLLADKTKVASDEAEKFVTENDKSFAVGTTQEQKTEMAMKNLQQEKFQKALDEWLKELKDKAKIWKVTKWETPPALGLN